MYEWMDVFILKCVRWWSMLEEGDCINFFLGEGNLVVVYVNIGFEESENEDDGYDVSKLFVLVVLVRRIFFDIFNVSFFFSWLFLECDFIISEFLGYFGFVLNCCMVFSLFWNRSDCSSDDKLGGRSSGLEFLYK